MAPSATTYSVGTIFLNVVPSFRNLQRDTRAAYKDAARNAREEFEKEFGKKAEESARELGRRQGNGLADEMRKAGEKSAKDYTGAFKTNLQRGLAGALKEIPKIGIDADTDEFDDKIAQVRERIVSLRDAKIGVDLDAGQAVIELGAIEAKLANLRSETYDPKISVELGATLAQIEQARMQLQRLGAMEVEPEINLKADRQLGAFERSLKNAAKGALENLPPARLEGHVDLNTALANVEISELRTQLYTILDREINLDLDAGVVRVQIEQLQARLDALSDRTHDIRIKTDVAAAKASLESFMAQVRAATDKEVEVEVEVELAERKLGSFERLLKQRIDSALAALPPVEVDGDFDLNATEAQREIAGLRAALFSISDAKIGVDLDAATAVQRVEVIRAKLLQLANESPDIQVRTDAAKALADLGAVISASRLADRDVDIEVGVDTGPALGKLAALSAALHRVSGSGNDGANSFRAFNAVILAAVTLGPALIPVLGAIAGGLALVGTSALGAVAGLGVAVLAFSGIGDAVKALGDVQKNAGKDALAAARTMRTASDGLRNAEQGLARAREQAARGAEDAARRVQDAERTLAQARRTAADATADAARRVKDAERALADARRAGAESAERNARTVADAEEALRDALEANTEAAEDAADAVEDATDRRTRAWSQQAKDVKAAARAETEALEAVQDARDRAQQANEQSAQRVASAARQLARAQEQAAQANERAGDRVVRAEQAITKAQRDAREAQEALTDARKAAQERLEDLAAAQEQGALNEREAVLALAEAQKEYDRVFNREYASDRAKEEADLGLDQAKKALEDIRRENNRVATERAEADAAGVEGSESVQDALQKVEDAQGAITEAIGEAADARLEQQRVERENLEAIAEASRERGEAEQERQRTEAEGLEAIRDAQTSLDDVRIASNETRLQNIQDVADAEEALADARKAQEKEREDAIEREDRARRDFSDARDTRDRDAKNSARDQADAQRGITDALREQARVAQGNAESLAAASRAVADARREQDQQAVDGARTVRDAQETLTTAQLNYRDALVQTGTMGSESMQKLEEAMGKLSPAGQNFARFIFGLRDEFFALRAVAQEGMLPGVQEAMEGLIDRYGPGFTRFVGTMAETLGAFAVKASEAFQSDGWEEFFATFEKYAPIFTDQWGTIILNVLEGIAGVMEAFAPTSKDFNDSLVEISDSFADWGANLENTKGFQDFLTWLGEYGPKVWEFVKNLSSAILNLLVALAPFGAAVLMVVDKVAKFISEMDPDTLGNITFALLGLVAAFQIGVGATSLLAGAVAVLATPIALIAASAAAAGVALVLLYKNFGPVRTVVDAVAGAFFALVRAIPLDFFLAFVAVIAAVGVAMLATAIKTGTLTLATGFATAAVGAFRTAWALLQLAFTASPLGLVVVGLTALVAGLVIAYKRSETFRGIIDGLWDAVVAGVKKLSVVVDFVKWLFEKIIDFALWLYDVMVGHSIIPDLVERIVELFQWMWQIVMKVFDAWKWYIQNVLAPVIEWLWKNIVKPAFEAIGEVIKFAWDRAIKPVFDALRDYLGSKKGALGDLFDAFKIVVTAVWEAIRAGADAMWTGKFGIKAILDAMSIVLGFGKGALGEVFKLIGAAGEAAWEGIQKALNVLWNGAGPWGGLKQVVANIGTALGFGKDGLGLVFGALKTAGEAAWNGIKDALSTAWEGGDGKGGIKGVLGLIKDALGAGKDGLQATFSATVESIKTIWEGLKEVFKTPLRFLIETVINKGLIGAFNKVAGFFGVDEKNQIPDVPVPAGLEKKADGGMIRGPWQGARADNVLGISAMGVPTAWVNPKEFVQPVSAVEYYGEDFMEAIRQRQLPRFADGGAVWPAPQSSVGTRYGNTYSGGRYHSGVDFRIPMGTQVLAAFDGFVKYIKLLRGSYGRHVVLGHAGGSETLYGHLTNPTVSTGDIIKAGQVVGISGNTGKSTGPHLHFEYRLPPGGYSSAIDPLPILAGASGNGGGGGGLLNLPDWAMNPFDFIGDQITDAMKGLGSGPIIDIIKLAPLSLLEQAKDVITALPGKGVDAIKGAAGKVAGALNPFDGDIVPGLFDQGGALPPGLSVVMNQTGQPEAILNPEQLRNLEIIANRGTTGAPAVHIEHLVAADTDGAVRKIRESQENAAAVYNLRAVAKG